jgi:hypothetical protein
VQGRTLHRLLLAGRARYRRVGTVMLCQRRFAVRFIAGSPSWIHRDARRRSLGTASACKISQGVTSAIPWRSVAAQTVAPSTKERRSAEQRPPITRVSLHAHKYDFGLQRGTLGAECEESRIWCPSWQIPPPFGRLANDTAAHPPRRGLPCEEQMMSAPGF